MKYPISFIIAIFLAFQANAQCKVLKKEIADFYKGDCQKKKAHGTGIAKGVDTYEGEFYKGLPHGQGTYTHASGAIYIGQFKKGKKHGKGTLALPDKPVIKGYWDNDDYIGTEITPYKVIRKSPFVEDLIFNRKKGRDQIILTVTVYGEVRDGILNISPTEGSHSLATHEKLRTTLQSVVFPYTAKFTFTYEGANYDAEFRITHGGTWGITIPINPSKTK
ncbi:MORN repeat-containing protein [Sediminicola luteus]|uniref:MORN motif-containing protein n=1 Tax=Sediminicola luteus TaxID=319238 RepID=A0A2A4G559_9FLAO|nr:hypothetical protein [Sediminicola luteus]PCE63573.1 hypothetical protein B7P33_15365 [Sediminicola luteus]